jgi:hypothetical protein
MYRRRAYYLIIFTLLLSCSTQRRAVWHINRAIKLDSSLLNAKPDTITIIQKEQYQDTLVKDSIEVDNDRLYIRVDREGDFINLKWKLKEQRFDTIYHTHLFDTIPTFKTRQDKRLDARIERTIIRQKGKTERVYIAKTKEKKNNWLTIFLIGFFIGFIIRYLVRILIKKYFANFML